MNNREERHRLLYRFIKEVQSCFVLRCCYPLTNSLRIWNPKYKCAQVKQVHFIYTLSGSNHSLLLLRYHWWMGEKRNSLYINTKTHTHALSLSHLNTNEVNKLKYTSFFLSWTIQQYIITRTRLGALFCCLYTTRKADNRQSKSMKLIIR